MKTQHYNKAEKAILRSLHETKYEANRKLIDGLVEENKAIDAFLLELNEDAHTDTDEAPAETPVVIEQEPDEEAPAPADQTLTLKPKKKNSRSVQVPIKYIAKELSIHEKVLYVLYESGTAMLPAEIQKRIIKLDGKYSDPKIGNVSTILSQNVGKTVKRVPMGIKNAYELI